MIYTLIALLALELAFRVFLEIREARLFGKLVPLALFRCIPLLNDFIPLPEKSLEGGVQEKRNEKFVEMHELAHRQKHHFLLRNMAKASFYSLMVLMIVVQLNSLQMGLLEIVLWFHLANFAFRIFYHFLCWQQEAEADDFAAQKLGKYEARKELSRLAKTERPMSVLFAFVYREHQPAAKRRAKYQ